ncbi:MAG: YeeE/YedE thiosulfate transporter family protein [Polyangiaceae bacterium]
MTFRDALLPSAGGALIGLAASLLLLTNGRIAGVSGYVGALFLPSVPHRLERLAFVLGFFLAGLTLLLIEPSVLPTGSSTPLWAFAVAGLLVGYGSRLGNGCTSGHGVCGISRFSPRSIVATLTFMGTAALTVFVVRHVLGATP